MNDDAQLDSAEFANMVEYDFDHFVNPHTIDYFHALDSNGDGVISKSEFSDDVLAIGKSNMATQQNLQNNIFSLKVF